MPLHYNRNRALYRMALATNKKFIFNFISREYESLGNRAAEDPSVMVQKRDNLLRSLLNVKSCDGEDSDGELAREFDSGELEVYHDDLEDDIANKICSSENVSIDLTRGASTKVSV